MYKRLIRILLPVSAAALLAIPLWTISGQNPAAPKTFTGEVTDTICAPSGSHAAIMAKMPNMGKDAATCARECAQIGAKYALVDDSTKQIYSVSDQSKLQAFAGQKVRVTGTVEGNKLLVKDVTALG